MIPTQPIATPLIPPPIDPEWLETLPPEAQQLMEHAVEVVPEEMA